MFYCVTLCEVRVHRNVSGIMNILSPNNDVREKMVVLLESLMRTVTRLHNLSKY